MRFAVLFLVLCVAACGLDPDRCRGMGPVSCTLLVDLPSALARPEPVPPPTHPGTCEDAALMTGEDGRWVAPMHDAGHHRIDLTGFSVMPPSGPGWCSAVNPARGLIFAKNNYANEVAYVPPPTPRRHHTLILLAYRVSNRAGVPATLDSIATEFGECVASGTCKPDQVRLWEESIGGAKCVGAIASVLDGGLMSRQRHFSCIHPENPAAVIRLAAIERFDSGHPWYNPLLLEANEADMRTFFSGLQFSSLSSR